MKNILVTGGAGYIGSHICVALLNADYKVLVLDNLSNSKVAVLERVKEITGRSLQFVKVDLLDTQKTAAVFEENSIDAVIHLAGLKAVGESNKLPLHYYRNNVVGTLNLCERMAKHNIKNIVFSSSATVYGEQQVLPIKESAATSPTNPYGRTKLIIENMLRDIYNADPDWNISILRYFNPVGAHKSGKIGENPRGIPNNLMPYIAQVAAGRIERLCIYGNDYPTADGTGVRDYIHVLDLVAGHIKALQKLVERPGIMNHNLGTGAGYSVLEIIAAFEAITGKKIPCEIVGRREGDVAIVYADCSLAKRELAWSVDNGMREMCEDVWRWQMQNPTGY